MSRDRIRVAAYALCRDEHGRILLCHIAPSVGAGDLWTLPGGGLEFGEPPASAVLRELHEETGYRGRSLRAQCGPGLVPRRRRGRIPRPAEW